MLDTKTIRAEIVENRNLISQIAVPTGDITKLLDLAWSREVSALSMELADLIEDGQEVAPEEQVEDEFVEAVAALSPVVVANGAILEKVRSSLRVIKPAVDKSESFGPEAKTNLRESLKSVEMLLLLHEETGKLLSGMLAMTTTDGDFATLEEGSEEADWMSAEELEDIM